MMERFSSGAFDFNDFLKQMKFMRKLGPFEGLLGLLPGGKALKDMKVDDRKIKQTEAIVLSMTPDERKKPNLIDAKRRQRIARGSGTQVSDVNQLLDQMKMMKKLFSNQGQLKGLMKMMGGGKGGMPDLGSMGGLGGMGGMPDLSQLGGMGGLGGPPKKSGGFGNLGRGGLLGGKRKWK